MTEADPPRPEDVRLILPPDGFEMAVPLEYVGVNEDGVHTWLLDCPPQPVGVGVVIGVLPPNTAVEMPLAGNPDGSDGS